MRLIKLSLHNLNSLAGKWSIDFTDAAYREEGIFAISGPTGAGKSTILDAICLALYKASPRLKEITQAANELMSRGCGECGAELIFEVQGRRYIARFHQHRARLLAAGELQQPSWTLAAADGTLLAEKTRDTKAQIEALIGLDFEQFTRAILLAQGDFTAFLKAPAKDQAALLEKMTGTEIYQQLGEEIHAIASEKRRQAEELDGLLQGRQPLSTEERSAITATLAQNAQTIEALQLTRQQIAAHQQWLEQTAACLSQIATQAAAEATAAQLEAALQQEWLPRLLQDAASRQLDAAAQTAQHRESSRRELLLQQEQAARAAQAAQTQEQAASALLRTTQTDCEHRKALLQQERQDLTQLRQLLHDESTAARLVQERDAAHQAALAAEQAARAAAAQARKEHQDLLAGQHAVGLYLRQHAADAGLASQIRLIEEHLKTWTGLLPTLAQQDRSLAAATQSFAQASADETTRHLAAETLRQALTPLQMELARLEKALQDESAIKTEEARQAELTQLHEEITQLKQKITMAEQRAVLERDKVALSLRIAELELLLASLASALPLQEKLVTEKQAAIEQEQQRQLLLDRIASLEVQRQALQDGQACPLCGATEHPFVHQLPPASPAEGLRLLQAELHRESQALHELLSRKTASLTEAKLKKELHDALAAKLDLLPPQDLAELRRDCQGRETAFTPLSHQLEALRALRRQLDKLRPQLSAESAKLQKAEEALLLASAARRQAEDELRRTQNEWQKTADLRTSQEQSLLAELTPFLPELAAPELQPALLPQLQERARLWQENENSRQKLAEDTIRKAEQLRHAQAAAEKSLHELNSARKALAEASSAEQTLKQQRLDRFGAKQPDDEEARLEAAIAAEEALLQTAQRQHTSARTTAAITANQAQALARSCADGEAAFRADQERWQRELQAAGFSDPAARLAVQLAPATRQDAERRLQAAASDLSSAQALLAEAQRQLAQLQARPWPERSPQDLLAALSSTQAQIETLLQAQGAESERLKADDALLRQQDDTRQRLAAARADLQPWDELSRLLGTKDGLKKFAQGLTLERLLCLANRHLHELRPRYQLSRTAAAEGEQLCVIDSHHADALRPVHNLSGGESFLVSLALALGLSEMASRKIELGCLFLDEGFGALDGESLQQSLEALARLQQQSGKLIGLISHIGALKEALPVQIEVTPRGRGRSEISGPGCTQDAAAPKAKSSRKGKG